MLKYLTALLLMFTTQTVAQEQTMQNIYDFKVKTINGTETTLASYKGKVMLIVNVASKCGYTPQYEGLEALYQKYKDQDFVILGFPCNQFGAQEPGTADEIQNFCRINFGVTFPLFAKINVNGSDADPLYKYLKSQQKGVLGSEAIKWNFTKFLVDKNGKVVKRFGSSTTPDSLQSEVEALIK